jgi:hypothetical protein
MTENYEFDGMKQELLIAFDKLDEEFDRTFDDNLNEFEVFKVLFGS